MKFEEWLWNTYFLQNQKTIFFCLFWSLVPVPSWSNVSRLKKKNKFTCRCKSILSSLLTNWDASSHEVRNNYLKILYWRRKYDQMQLQQCLQVIDTQTKTTNIYVSWSNAFSSYFFLFHANYNLIAEWSWDDDYLLSNLLSNLCVVPVANGF